MADLVLLPKCRDINIRDGFTIRFLERSFVKQSDGNKVVRDAFVEMLILFKVEQKYLIYYNFIL